MSRLLLVLECLGWLAVVAAFTYVGTCVGYLWSTLAGWAW